MEYSYKELDKNNLSLLKELLKVFSVAFGDVPTYQDAVPNDQYLQKLLAQDHFIALVALADKKVIGGLVAYELQKFEQDRRKIYIYDLAVATPHRRKGVATQLINELKKIAKKRKAYVIFVQADKGDVGAIALYESLGVKEDVFHFDIGVK